MLSKVPRPNTAGPASGHPDPPSSPQTSMNAGALTTWADNPLQSSSWEVPSLDPPSQTLPANSPGASDLNAPDPLNTLFDQSENIDWVSLKTAQLTTLASCESRAYSINTSSTPATSRPSGTYSTLPTWLETSSSHPPCPTQQHHHSHSTNTKHHKR